MTTQQLEAWRRVVRVEAARQRHIRQWAALNRLERDLTALMDDLQTQRAREGVERLGDRREGRAA